MILILSKHKFIYKFRGKSTNIVNILSFIMFSQHNKVGPGQYESPPSFVDDLINNPSKKYHGRFHQVSFFFWLLNALL